jgi:hypothetical protein
VGEAVEVIC